MDSRTLQEIYAQCDRNTTTTGGCDVPPANKGEMQSFHASSSTIRGNANISDKDTRLLLTEANGEYGEDVESMRSESPMLRLGNNEFGRGAAQSGNCYSAQSAKINALLRKLHLQQDNPIRQEPAFHSAYKSTASFSALGLLRMLDKVEQALRAEGFNCQRIDGQSSLKSRADAMRRFSEERNFTVMLTSIGSAGEG